MAHEAFAYCDAAGRVFFGAEAMHEDIAAQAGYAFGIVVGHQAIVVRRCGIYDMLAGTGVLDRQRVYVDNGVVIRTSRAVACEVLAMCLYVLELCTGVGQNTESARYAQLAEGRAFVAFSLFAYAIESDMRFGLALEMPASVAFYKQSGRGLRTFFLGYEKANGCWIVGITIENLVGFFVNRMIREKNGRNDCHQGKSKEGNDAQQDIAMLFFH